MRIALTQGQFAIMDEADYARLSQWKWRAQYDKNLKSFYALRTARKKEGRERHLVIMHREILGMADTDERLGDHRNRNTLDNRRDNLRIATYQQNNSNKKMPKSNSSGFKGVTKHSCGKFQAQYQKNGKMFHLGLFTTALNAHEAYRTATQLAFGEFARLD